MGYGCAVTSPPAFNPVLNNQTALRSHSQIRTKTPRHAKAAAQDKYPKLEPTRAAFVSEKRIAVEDKQALLNTIRGKATMMRMSRTAFLVVVCLAMASLEGASSIPSSSRRLKFYSLERFLGPANSPQRQQRMQMVLPSTLDGGRKASPENVCGCALDGVSGGVSTGRFGCQNHVSDLGDIGPFCMVVGGAACTESQPSTAFPGASWKRCTNVDEIQRDEHPCTCAEDGISRGNETGRFGCKEHLPDTEPFCYVIGGSSCPSARHSIEFRGASWRDCGTP